MTGRSLMIQGTGSGVGKSFLTAALCRIFRNRGLSVAPFKSQNMSNNACVCRDGGEIARAQAMQAEACGIEPAVDMNPILLKPTTDKGSQVVVHGRVVGTMVARQYQAYKHQLLDRVQASLNRLLQSFDVVVIEGAGSPAEINLREHDIANMRVAEWADAPVLLVGDIERGGVFAQLVGTMELLLPAERERVRGFIINKFRGDPAILEPGLKMLEERASRRVFGVVPVLKHRLPEEDTLDLSRTRAPAPDKLRVVVLRLPRIANFDEFDPLRNEPDVDLRFVDRPEAPPDLLILPGTKSTIADLEHLRRTGLVDWVAACYRQGTTVFGICGGFQMLGTRILDPERIESDVTDCPGLGLIDQITIFEHEKVTRRVVGTDAATGAPVSGYEIHMGRTERPAVPPLLRIDGRDEGVRLERLMGTYVHGLFESSAFRRAVLNEVRGRRGWPPLPLTPEESRDELWNRLAADVERAIDVSAILALLRR